jgi:MinD superfamily P-loop ATPase
VIINRHGIGNDDVLDYCKTENIQVIAKIPNMRKVAELYAQGKLVYPEIPAVKAELQKVADFILDLKKGEVA